MMASTYHPMSRVGGKKLVDRPSRPLQPIRKDLVIRFRRQRLAREAIMAAKEISVKKYVVRLSGEERERLETLLRKGKSPARRVLKARILLKADVSEAGKGWSDNRIIEALETSPSMVYRVRKQLVEEGFEAVLSRKPRAMPAIARIFDGEKEAKLIALACSKPPKGRARWTLRLLENKVVELGIVDRASDSTIGRALKKNTLQPHRRQHWVIPPKANSAFVAAMEDVLAVYTRPRDGDCPLVCLDETSKQLIAETRVPICAALTFRWYSHLIWGVTLTFMVFAVALFYHALSLFNVVQ